MINCSQLFRLIVVTMYPCSSNLLYRIFILAASLIIAHSAIMAHSASIACSFTSVTWPITAYSNTPAASYITAYSIAFAVSFGITAQSVASSASLSKTLSVTLAESPNTAATVMPASPSIVHSIASTASYTPSTISDHCSFCFIVNKFFHGAFYDISCQSFQSPFLIHDFHLWCILPMHVLQKILSYCILLNW